MNKNKYDKIIKNKIWRKNTKNKANGNKMRYQ